MKNTTVSLVLALSMAGCPGGGIVGEDGGATAGDGGSSANQDLVSAQRGGGTVMLSSSSYVSGGQIVNFSYAVAAFGSAGTGPQCTTTTLGACKVSTCQQLPPAPDGGRGNVPDAGNINITGGKRTVALMPQGDGSYHTVGDGTNVLWSGGETLTIAAAGHGVAPFNTTLTAPTAVKLARPTPPAAGNALMVNRSLDLALMWSGGQGSDVQVILATSAASGSAVVTCQFPGGDSMGTIPSSALMGLQAVSGSFVVYSQNAKMLAAGDYDVNVVALTQATDSNSQLVSYQASYQ